MTGWSCPSCNRCYAPHVEMCSACASQATAPQAPRNDPGAKNIRQLWREWALWAEKNRDDWRVCEAQCEGILETDMELAGNVIRLGDLPWWGCGIKAADAWRMAMMKKVSRRGRPFSPATRNRMLTTLQSMLSWHAKRENITHNPLSKMARESEAAGKREGYFSEAKLDEFLAGAHPLLAKIMRTAHRCGGMRNSEVRCLRIDEIDWESRDIVIRGNRHKNGKPKRIPITDEIFEMLKAQKVLAPGPYLFHNPRSPSGDPVPAGTFQWWIESQREKTGMLLLGERPTMHHTRHGFGVLSIAKGASSALVREVMGHASSKAADGYQRMVGEAAAHMRELMNRRIGPQSAPVPPSDVKKNHEG